jgi:hypothetical protein
VRKKKLEESEKTNIIQESEKATKREKQRGKKEVIDDNN